MSTAHDTELAEWFTTGEGKSCADPVTLESASSQEDFQRYLTHRLQLAFAAGWDRCHGQVAAVIADSIGKVIN